MKQTDWDQLTKAAKNARLNGYAPYSKFLVGAAGLTAEGRIVTGCNVENASYGLTLCAECSMVSALFASGGSKLLAVVVVGPADEILMPCGRCRQLISEHAHPDLQLATANGVLPFSAVLPMPFGPSDLLNHDN